MYPRAIYTAAVLLAVQSTVIKTRQILKIHRVNASYSVGKGNVLSSTESALASINQDLLLRTDANSDKYIIETPPAKRD